MAFSSAISCLICLFVIFALLPLFLSFASAAAAGHDLEALYLVTDPLVKGGVGQKHQPVRAGVRVRVLVFVVGCCREWIASGRYSVPVHSRLLFLWAGAGECANTRPAQ